MVADKKKKDKPASSCPKQFGLHAAQPPGIFFFFFFSFLKVSIQLCMFAHADLCYDMSL